ncbi:MAG: P27 family phage terminase small subunit [Burkholderiales bacterium]|nr:P27 family phage terminase small subunit [Burkholderiales bacterium]
MSARSAAIFRQLVTSVEPGHFDTCDLPLLRNYAAACEQAEIAEAALAKHGAVTSEGRASPWLVAQEKAHRAIVAYSMRLQLSPQSRHATRRRLPPLGGFDA